VTGHGSRTSRRYGDHEAGSGTIYVLGVVAVLLLLAIAIAGAAAAMAARTAAQGAADLAAIAAATADMYASGDPCDVARHVVERNHASIDSCEAHGMGIYLVGARTTTGLGGTATAFARAGPASVAGSP
jgi:secretion/DNA translocation related TadE-like protein